jgi:hypothetical protein
MHYFYYLKLKNYLQYIALIHYKLSLVFKIYPTCFGASLAPSSGVSLNQIYLLSWPSVMYVVQLLFRGTNQSCTYSTVRVTFLWYNNI